MVIVKSIFAFFIKNLSQQTELCKLKELNSLKFQLFNNNFRQYVRQNQDQIGIFETFFVFVYTFNFTETINIIELKNLMSFKATLDIAINFSYLKIKQFYKEGFIYYTACVYYLYDGNLNARKYAFPVDIVSYESKKKNNNNLIKVEPISQGFIDNDQIHCISRLIPINFDNKSFQENCTCYFKMYIDTDIINQIELFIQVKLMFRKMSRNNKNNSVNTQQSQQINTFKGKLSKNYNLFTYMPINFDKYQAISLVSSFHAIISDFRFTKEDQQMKIKQKQSTFVDYFNKKHDKIIFESFFTYLSHITQNFLQTKVKTFYNYYKNFLINTYSALLSRYKKLYEKINETVCTKKLKQYEKYVQKSYSQKIQQKFKKIYNINIGLNYRQFSFQTKILSQYFIQDFYFLKNAIFQLWTQFNRKLQSQSYTIHDFQRRQYVNMIEQRYKNNIFSHQVKMTRDHTFSQYDDSGKSHLQQAIQQNKKRFSTEGKVWEDTFLIEDMSFAQKEQKNIKMFQQIFPTANCQKLTAFHENLSTKSEQKYFRLSKDLLSINPKLLMAKKSNQSLDIKHLIFLVHGFGANRSDMLQMKFCIQEKYPIKVIISVANVGRTQGSIDKSGERLAAQVKQCIKLLKTDSFKLSFIGHSMGGLFIRSALSRLQQYRTNFYTYISICSPHLGYLYEPPKIIKLGIWLYRTFQNCQSLTEIEIQCYLYKLARQDGLKYFNNIGFVASSQDSYVPYESSRIQKSNRILSDTSYATKKIIEQMIDGILLSLSTKYISRIDVVFNLEQNNINTLIGRTGHVKFLSDQQFIKEFVICFSKFFK